MSDDTPLYILDNRPLFKTLPVLYDLGFAYTRLLFNPQIDDKMPVDLDLMKSKGNRVTFSNYLNE